MRLRQSEPGGVLTDPALKDCSRPSSYTARAGVQERRDFPEAERRLVAAGWFDPVQLARDADRLGLHISDFRDQLCGVVVGYLRDCGESGRIPTLAGAEGVLDSFAVPRDPDELFFLLIDTPAPKGDSLADLILAVQREADDRAEQLCRELTRNAWRAMVRGLCCPHCNAGVRFRLSGRVVA